MLAFLLWSLPGAIGMYLLSLGVSKIDPILPGPVYALLSGLNSSTVGIIALAAVQLARKAITDPITRLIVLISACAGLCYNALWYFPTIIVAGGMAAVVWDRWMGGWVGRVMNRTRTRSNETRANEEPAEAPMETLVSPSIKSGASRRMVNEIEPDRQPDVTPVSLSTTENRQHKVPLKAGIAIIICFFS